jgi:hypothetical protein
MLPHYGLEEKNRSSLYLHDLLCEKKVIFLNEKNISELIGYKAIVKLKDSLTNRSEIHIILTGFSNNSAKNLFDKLEKLPLNEIYGDNK